MAYAAARYFAPEYFAPRYFTGSLTLLVELYYAASGGGPQTGGLGSYTYTSKYTYVPMPSGPHSGGLAGVRASYKGVSGTGGTTVSGQCLFNVISNSFAYYSITAEGGPHTGGIASVRPTYKPVMSGGDSMAGGSSVGITIAYSSTGGLQTGGSIPTPFVVLVVPMTNGPQVGGLCGAYASYRVVIGALPVRLVYVSGSAAAAPETSGYKTTADTSYPILIAGHSLGTFRNAGKQSYLTPLVNNTRGTYTCLTYDTVQQKYVNVHYNMENIPGKNRKAAYLPAITTCAYRILDKVDECVDANEC